MFSRTVGNRFLNITVYLMAIIEIYGACYSVDT